MKTLSNANYSAIKRILATFADLPLGNSPPRTLNQQRIAKKLIKKL